MTGEGRGWHDSVVAEQVERLDRADRDRLLRLYAVVLAELDGCGCEDRLEHAERLFRVRSLRACDAGDPLWRVWGALAERERLAGQVRRLELLQVLDEVDGDASAVVESPLLDALAALPDEERERARREVSEYVERLRAMLEAMCRGVSVAPLYRRPVAEQIGVEAERRERIGDPTAGVWRAWQELADTDAAMRRIERELGLE